MNFFRNCHNNYSFYKQQLNKNDQYYFGKIKLLKSRLESNLKPNIFTKPESYQNFAVCKWETKNI